MGFEYQNKDFYCIDKCPVNALSMAINPLYETFGDYRWTSDLILSTWSQAETGKIPHVDLEYRTGRSGGGFDRLRFNFPKERNWELGIGQGGKKARGQEGKEGTGATHYSPLTNHYSLITTHHSLITTHQSPVTSHQLRKFPRALTLTGETMVALRLP